MRQEVMTLRPSLNDTLRPQVTETLLTDVTQRILRAFAPHQVILSPLGCACVFLLAARTGKIAKK